MFLFLEQFQNQRELAEQRELRAIAMADWEGQQMERKQAREPASSST
jgi:hypothetical protein